MDGKKKRDRWIDRNLDPVSNLLTNAGATKAT